MAYYLCKDSPLSCILWLEFCFLSVSEWEKPQKMVASAGSDRMIQIKMGFINSMGRFCVCVCVELKEGATGRNPICFSILGPENTITYINKPCLKLQEGSYWNVALSGQKCYCKLLMDKHFRMSFIYTVFFLCCVNFKYVC